MTTQDPLAAFIRKHLTPPTGSSPADIKARLFHWIQVANNPETFCEDQSPYALAAKRRSARQNVVRILKKHPEFVQMGEVTQ
jgi:hypothetical protein